MKVTGPKGSNSIEKKKKTGGSKESSGSEKFGSLLTSKASEAEEQQAVRNISKIDSLLSAQASEDPAQQASRQKMAKRGHDILDSLEKVKMALINGNLRVSHIENITHMVSVNRERVDDPELTYLLDEIDLRAQVELAKLEAARDAALSQLQTV